MMNLQPVKAYRDFDAAQVVNKTVTINLQHVSDNEASPGQYVSFNIRMGEEGLDLSGWAQKVLGDKGTAIKRKIKAVYLAEHANGGRSSHRATTYRDFFNDEHKEVVKQYWAAQGTPAALFSAGGDPDQADVIVHFEDFVIDSYCWDMRAPEEWYSELYANNVMFKFEPGFYETADAAIKAFTEKPVDDLFGERYFPIIVFPVDTKADVRSIAYHAKGCSKPIVTNDHIIIGTRCKAWEFRDAIQETYKAGGRVPIGYEWSW